VLSRLSLVVTVAGIAACGARATPRPTLSLVTTAERSQWMKTGRYDEAVALCHDFARVYAGVECVEIGRTLEERPIVALHVARAPGKPTIYIQAGVHAGEIEGKDAGFWFLRDLLDGTVAPGALAAVNLVFVPCINPDGHERFAAHNRPNQRGPEEMGFRTNGVRMNLNRDFVKADSLEIQAVLGVFRAHDPIVLVDLHATDGAKFEHDVAVLVSPAAPRTSSLDEAARELSDHLQQRLGALGHLPLPFYPSFEIEDDPASGFAAGEAPPRFSQSYAAARGRLGILVETHSWRTYKERARSMYDTLQALLERATTDAAGWRASATESERADDQLRGHELPVVWENGPHTTEIPFRGYAYEKRDSDISGATWIVYDETTPQIWNVPLRDEVIPKISAHVPVEGYVIDGGFAAIVAPILERHGIRTTKIPGRPTLTVDAFRATSVTFDPPFEGRSRAKIQGAWKSEQRTLDQGALFVSTRQPLLRLIVNILDPAGPDSLAQWGELSSAFEKKEYMEAYVAEEVAREQLARDPSLRAQFDAAVAADPELAKSPAMRLEWFYRRHPSWDERVNLIPIYRTDRPIED
jgi:hypothetical protein